MSSVAFLTLSSKPWGAQHSLAIIIEQLAMQGTEVTVVCESEAVAEFFRGTPAEVVLVTSRGGRIGSLGSFHAWVRANRRDTYVLFSPALVAIAPVLKLTRPKGSRVVVDLHDTPQGGLDKRVLGVSLKFADSVICISDFVRDYASTAAQTVVIERPIEIPDKLSGREPGEPIAVGIVGRIDPEKRIELAIEAIAQLGEVATLEVYGEPYVSQSGYLDEVKSAAERALAPQAFTYHGRQPIDEIMTSIDILVSANPREPSGRTIAEAMAFGIPVVVPDRGGAGEQVIDGETGLRFRADDARSLAEQIDRIRTTPDLRARLVTNGRAQVEQTRSAQALGVRYNTELFSMRPGGANDIIVPEN